MSDSLFPTFNDKTEIWADIGKTRVAKQIFEFIDEWESPIGDMGNPNFKKTQFEKLLNQDIESIYGFDFDRIPWNYDKKFNTIFCFEILEHLFNPLLFLEQLKKLLESNEGTIYLSTPYRAHFLWTKHHYHEIDDTRIKWLFDKAGLKIAESRKIRLFRGWKYHLRGIRPLLRLHTFTRVYKLKIKE